MFTIILPITDAGNILPAYHPFLRLPLHRQFILEETKGGLTILDSYYGKEPMVWGNAALCVEELLLPRLAVEKTAPIPFKNTLDEALRYARNKGFSRTYLMTQRLGLLEEALPKAERLLWFRANDPDLKGLKEDPELLRTGFKLKDLVTTGCDQMTHRREYFRAA